MRGCSNYTYTKKHLSPSGKKNSISPRPKTHTDKYVLFPNKGLCHTCMWYQLKPFRWSTTNNQKEIVLTCREKSNFSLNLSQWKKQTKKSWAFSPINWKENNKNKKKKKTKNACITSSKTWQVYCILILWMADVQYSQLLKWIKILNQIISNTTTLLCKLNLKW